MYATNAVMYTALFLLVSIYMYLQKKDLPQGYELNASVSLMMKK